MGEILHFETGKGAEWKMVTSPELEAVVISGQCLSGLLPSVLLQGLDLPHFHLHLGSPQMLVYVMAGELAAVRRAKGDQ